MVPCCCRQLPAACRNHDVTVIFTDEIFHAAANVLTAVGTPSCVPDFLLLLAFPFGCPLLLLKWVPVVAVSLLLLASLLADISAVACVPPIAGGLAVAGGSAVAGVNALADTLSLPMFLLLLASLLMLVSPQLLVSTYSNLIYIRLPDYYYRA